MSVTRLWQLISHNASKVECSVGLFLGFVPGSGLLVHIELPLNKQKTGEKIYIYKLHHTLLLFLFVWRGKATQHMSMKQPIWF